MSHYLNGKLVNVAARSSSERLAPISILSTKSCFALIECWENKSLQKYKRVWRGFPDGLPISGNTVASLGRDGLLTVAKTIQAGTARLTERGTWFVRTLLAASTRDGAIEKLFRGDMVGAGRWGVVAASP